MTKDQLDKEIERIANRVEADCVQKACVAQKWRTGIFHIQFTDSIYAKEFLITELIRLNCEKA